ncbi:AraC family transcriptional regulator [Salmonella enterica subsp. enterica]|nr:AraC family transcriptional regulator [Salmonella enterica subsp. enterica] [Salmonella enterica subsp. enterica serovar Menston]
MRDWCLTQLPHLPADSRLHTTQPQLQNPQLFQLYQQIVTSITQQQTAGLPALIIHLLRACRYKVPTPNRHAPSAASWLPA